MTDQQFDIPALPVLLPLWLIATGVAMGWLVRRSRPTAGRATTVVLTTTYAAAVLAVTLLPLQVALGVYANQVAWYNKVNVIPVLTIDPSTFVLNVVMTVPLGLIAGLVLKVRSYRRAAWVGFLVSLAIELLQAVTNIALSSGRTGDVNDLIANTLGTLVGYHLFTRLQRARPTASLVAWLAGGDPPVRDAHAADQPA